MLTRNILLCGMLAVFCPVMATETPTLGELAHKINSLDDEKYVSDAVFEVWLPNASNPVVYSVRLAGADNGGADSLLGFDYLIEWKLPHSGGESHGFSSYFRGNHYRYRDGRLQEYHAEDDASPFVPGGDIRRGVHRQAQFVNLLPGSLADELVAMEADSSFRYTIDSRGESVNVSGSQTLAGNEVRTFRYSFNASDGRPMRLDIDTNPGQISEQTMTVEYGAPQGDADVPRTEEALTKIFPEEFARYRQSDFRLEKLPGERLPEFSAQTTGGERFTHHKPDGFDSPVLMLFLDAEAGDPARVLDEVRQAIDMYPGTVRPLIAFVDNRLDAVEGVSGHPLPGETVLYGARSVARDCGVTVTPTLIFVNSDGTVVDFIQGMNKNLVDEVLELISRLK
ncbi:MAG: hypothetical protein K2G24_07235 [Muribaculaceae bacterium]|nr:hypothetical protein [Muribaculaceae bacterium]